MKQRMKQALAVLLCVLLLAGAAPAAGLTGVADVFGVTAAAETVSGSCGDSVEWTLDTQTGTMTISGTGDMTEYVSSTDPERPWLDYRDCIRTVCVTDGVTSIGRYAFWDCNNLTDVTIPDSVTYIGSSAFNNCKSLTEVTIPNGVTSIGNDAFHGCASLTRVTIPNGVTSIGNDAFHGCESLTRVTIPDSVTTIGSYAFYFCSGLTAVTIGKGVRTIGDYVFSYCGKIETFSVDADNTLFCSDANGVLYSADKTVLVRYPAGNARQAFAIPNSVTSISKGAFADSASLVSLAVPNSVQTIGSAAFSRCSALVSMTIPDSVTVIGNSLFSGCSNLAQITIPNSVTMIDNYAFAGCKKLTNVTIPNSVTSIGIFTFLACKQLKSVTIPDSVQSIGHDAFDGCAKLRSVTIPNGVQCIEDGTFRDCTELQSVTIPNSVTGIGKDAFNGCKSLAHMTIGNGVTEIGRYAFLDCENLRTVHIPSCTTMIDAYAFLRCDALACICSTAQSGYIRSFAETIGVRYRVCYGHCAHTDRFGRPVWTWAEDYGSAAAVFTCERCGDTQTVTADTIGCESVTEPTCEADALVRYHAAVTFMGETYKTACEPVPDDGTALGHDYGEPVWTWAEDYSSAAAAFTCARCGDTQTLTADEIGSETVEKPTCDTDALVRYRAAVSFAGETYETVSEPVSDDGSALGHDYGEPVWTWAEDYSSAAAAFTCMRCGDTQTVTADTIGCESVTEPTCETDALVRYRAAVTFAGETYETFTEPVPDDGTALGHDYGEPVWTWAEDYSSAAAAFTCTRCTYTQTVTADAIGCESVTVPTCDTDALVRYRAAVTFAGETYETFTEPVPDDGTALGHACGEPVWTWAEDYSSAAAAFTCARCTYTQTVTADAIGCESVTVPTCDMDALVRYRAAVTFAGETYENFTEPVPDDGTALGHTYGEPVWTWAEDYRSAAAAFTCTRCGDKQTLTADEIGSETVETPTCDTDALVRYRAAVTFAGETFETVSEPVPDDGSALGHDYGDDPVWVWSEDHREAAAVFICGRCSAIRTVTADVNETVIQALSCTCDKIVIYTASVLFADETYTDRADPIIVEPATGHWWADTYTCIDEQTHGIFCTVCDAPDAGSAAPHHFVTVSENTDPETGRICRVLECDVCGFRKVEEIDPPSPGRPTVAVSDVSVGCRAEWPVTVTVELRNNPGLIATCLHLGYDPQQLRLVQVENGDVFEPALYTACDNLKQNPYKVLWCDSYAQTNYRTNGTLVTLTFEVQPTATVGQTTVTVAYDADSTVDVDLHDVELEMVNGTVTLTNDLPGDANGNGKVNLVDAILIERWLAQWDVQIDRFNADVNKDGKVNLRDTILIRRYLVGGWDVELI